MKALLFSILLALTFTSALADKNSDIGVNETPALVNLFKKPQSSIINVEKSGGGRQCAMECWNAYRNCLRQGGGMGHMVYCETIMENCTNNCYGL